MAKPKVRYECSSCGSITPSWSGKCSSCGEWNTLHEHIDITKDSVIKHGKSLSMMPIAEAIKKSANNVRLKSGDKQLDAVLGGGFVKGSVVLLAGQPGIGKSTLLMQTANMLAVKYKVLYISGEESVHQVASRANRLGSKDTSLDLASSTRAEDIAKTISSSEHDVVVVDSIQTITTDALASSAGTVSQITNSTNILTVAAKFSNTALVMVGHVTKDGSIAGPKVLEHSVDTVLQLEGDRYGGFKILRTVKNRFGSTNETAIYEMDSSGMKEVKNASAALLAERQIVDGSVVLATMEGSRPLLVEIQALVNKTSYGYPKRTSSGFDLNRLNLLTAMLERRTKLVLGDKDIYINIVGGINVTEPAADLAVAMAIGSAAKGLKLSNNAVVFGELGLSGEIRHVPFVEKRIAEAKKLGFNESIGPKTKSLKASGFNSVITIRDALNSFLEKK